MDSVMRSEFKKTFEEVNREFKKVFRELFNGGEASLSLTDEADLLNTGVEIVACPPGKKLTTISLLSGGEKTLTAISLLFAILNVKTIPFCLFDEVEAALDDVNVLEFGKYLEHYKNKTQFLIITHKKKTMEFANTLYGITMQESGVSKLVSVKLTEKM
jgi:chromosome segregation protein